MPKYGEYSKYEQYRIPKYFKYRQYCSIPANPKILLSTAVFQSIEPQNTASMAVWQYSQYRILKYCESASTSSIPQYIKPKYCEYMKYQKNFLSKIHYFTPRYSEHL